MECSTEDYDTGKKFFYNMQIESLKAYIMIDSVKMFIRTGRKQADNAWRFEEYKEKTDAMCINSIGFTVTLQDIYEGVM
ncbi:Uma2 family endonuclease [Terrimonas sp.]|uniref:Uma2 family endonuclease n=1 Tax=Terrimonas sp. TaxID=1914338 RepID=UPI001056E3F5|nr:Uma2 family endonuclease [Terrimonas sp.]